MIEKFCSFYKNHKKKLSQKIRKISTNKKIQKTIAYRLFREQASVNLENRYTKQLKNPFAKKSVEKFVTKKSEKSPKKIGKNSQKAINEIKHNIKKEQAKDISENQRQYFPEKSAKTKETKSEKVRWKKSKKYFSRKIPRTRRRVREGALKKSKMTRETCVRAETKKKCSANLYKTKNF